MCPADRFSWRTAPSPLNLTSIYMARWVAKQLELQAEEYDRLLAENSELAPLLYKARWLAEDPEALTFDNLH